MKNRFLLSLLLFAFCFAQAQEKYVGGDISMLTKYEKANVSYLGKDGKKISNLLEYFRDDAGFNIARVRLFVNPTNNTGVVQDVDYVLALGKRIKDAGMQFMLDFHYSDTWADPAAQWIPAKWTSLTEQQLSDTVYSYTKTVLEKMVAGGATPDFIQTGNEISYGMLWGPEGKRNYYCHYNKDNNWDRFKNLLSQAGKACREVCPNAKIIIHTERTNNWTATKSIYERLGDLDYDIIGLSYYPEWHNSITVLKSTLNALHNNFSDKPVMIVETGYYNNYYRSDATFDFQSTWPASPAGQKAFLDDLVNAVKDMDFMLGILYWFPEENPYNNHVYEPWYNHGLFNPKTGKVSDALFSLMALLGKTTNLQPTAEQIVGIDFNKPIYGIDGRKVAYSVNMPHGVYVQEGRKFIK
ncbi:MAG: glycosyl hydrolase 53 family protein [Paludibacteraceae bacterium]|nr:glycosyl hydrolase 53 family protein [Paludibacteraceae bacterium]